ncbi:hypothetical protein [Halobacterium sp. CBA1126]|uniref:hypothetical protein n=1 Tax=Halobacterium sp. CBA1126 TaxID=2668074 RepID=UPI0012F7FCD1|nr:hypothetical protein [Halobacterium sp. CBA1126]MUV60217.1 hypothetical protein [Halobacterium sp. CBA1126]
MRAGNKDVVLDCGANEDPEFSPLKWLNTSYYGMNSIDFLIISHPHQDHIEDLDMMKELGLEPSILQRPKQATELVEENLEEAREREKEDYIEDAEYYLNVLDEYDGDPDVLPSNPAWSNEGETASAHRADGGIPDRGVTFHHFGANEQIGSDNYQNLNNLSRVTLVNCHGFRMVAMGDLLQGGIDEIKDDNDAMSAIEDVEVLVAPHHGRDSSFDRDLVSHINPDLVVFSDKTAEHTVSDKYGQEANGASVYYEDTEEWKERKVVSTNADGRIRLQANNETDWRALVYGGNYASSKASSTRYQKAD